MTKAALLKTLALAGLVLFLSLPKGGGAWLGLFVPVFLIWTLFNIARMANRPQERRVRLIRLGIWAAVLAIAGATQTFWEGTTRELAGDTASALLEYRYRTGAYPQTLEEAGLKSQVLSGEWQISYRLREGKPELSYPASIMPLTAYEYDFDKRQWRTNAY